MDNPVKVDRLNERKEWQGISQRIGARLALTRMESLLLRSEVLPVEAKRALVAEWKAQEEAVIVFAGLTD